MKNRYFTKTPLVNSLENSERLITSIRTRDDFGSDYYLRTKNTAKKFKECYLAMSVFDHSDSELLSFFVKHFYCFRLYGFSCENFFSYELNNKTLAEADQFINRSYRKSVVRICNQSDYVKYFSNKINFNTVFKEYVKRDWLDASTCSLDELKRFVEQHPTFIVKPINSTRGMGVRIVGENESSERLFNKYRKAKLIIEEIVENHDSIKDFNRTTLNTVRTNTLITASGKSVVIAAGIRFGREKAVVDNHAAGGLIAVVDIDTGLIISDGMDKQHTLYDRHPDSQKPIKGFQIPCWEEVIRVSLEAAELVPQIRLVGWDIAIKPDNAIELIEGNTSPDLSMLQEANQIGLKPLLKSYIDDIIAFENTVDASSLTEKEEL